MAKPKVRPKTPKLDMNPMVDMAFLLVSFFMLTTTFKTAEPVIIEKAKSQSELKVPERHVINITVAADGRVFFGIDGKFSRKRLLQQMGEKFGISYTPDQLEQFALVTNFGMPVQEITNYLALPPNERQDYPQNGVPIDSTQNQLTDWVLYARVVDPRARFAINADKDVPYWVVDKVVQTLLKLKIYRFNLITELEKTS